MRHRNLKPEFNDEFFSSMDGIPSFPSERAWDWLYPDDGAYDVCTLPENTRGIIFGRRVYLRFNGGTLRELWIENPKEEPARLTILPFAMTP
ncbi:MAG: hypothetical protein ACI8QS_003035 [Planctomycetota bacterium]